VVNTLSKASQTKLRQIIICTIVGVAVFGSLASLGWLDRLEWMATDVLQRKAAQKTKPHPDVQFIVLDQKSLNAGENEFGLYWPWPRETYVHILSFLAKAQARLILFDFVFTESTTDVVVEDEALGEAIQQSTNVYMPIITHKKSDNEKKEYLYSVRPDIFFPTNAIPAKSIPVSQGITFPIPQVLKTASGFGDARFTPDTDGVLRRIQPLVRFGENILPHYGLAALKKSNTTIRLEKNVLHWGDQIWPLDQTGGLVLRYPGTWQAYARTSLIDVVTSSFALMEGETPTIDPEQFKDKIVVIGSTAAAAMDLRKTPLESKTPGFYIVASTYIAALTNNFYDERWKSTLLWPLLILLSLLGAFWGSQPFARGILLFGITSVVCSGVLLWLFFVQGVILFMLPPLFGLVVAYGFSLGMSFQQEQKQKRFIQGAFSQVLSKTVLDNLMRHPERLQAGGEEDVLSIYFSDLVGFTQISEKLKPKELVEVLNIYLGHMVETIVDENEGYVDKFIGDAVMAFWGAPIPIKDHAYRACCAALQNQAKLEKMQTHLQAKGLTAPLAMRIGIHTGPAVVGMMGSPKKLNYTIMGDAVNLASRLEGVNKQFGTAILASWETISQVGDKIISREIDRIRVKGKNEPTRIFEVMGMPGKVDEKTEQLISLYQEGTMAFWQRDFKTALGIFAKAAEVCPEDQSTQIFMQRAKTYTTEPPEPTWDGVTTLSSK
jgi:adenylate cyclase